jgi:hypothetical protein
MASYTCCGRSDYGGSNTNQRPQSSIFNTNRRAFRDLSDALRDLPNFARCEHFAAGRHVSQSQGALIGGAVSRSRLWRRNPVTAVGVHCRVDEPLGERVQDLAETDVPTSRYINDR